MYLASRGLVHQASVTRDGTQIISVMRDRAKISLVRRDLA